MIAAASRYPEVTVHTKQNPPDYAKAITGGLAMMI